MDLKQRFYNLLSNYIQDKDLTSSLWNEIYTHYSEKHRAYHNLNHLKEIFSYFDVYKDKLIHPDIVALSIFYHDIIYNIWSKDNEEKSADFMIDKLSDIVDASSLKEVYNQIIATKTHTATNNDTKWLLDFDLAILGQSADTYSKYTKQIRKEYKTVPSFIYKKGRKKVLLHFLNKPVIFATENFIKLYNKKAKENLTNELKYL